MPRPINKSIFIKAAPLAALMILALLTNGRRPRNDNRPLNTFRLIANYPVSAMNNGSLEILTMKDTVGMAISDNYSLYYLAPKMEFQTNRKIPGTESYFFFGDTRKMGILFQSLADIAGQTHLNVDSFLGARAFKTFHVSANPGTRVDSQTDVDGHNLFEAYVPAERKDGNSVDSIYLYYSADLNAIPYSFSPELDSLKKKKLVKVRLLFNAAEAPGQKMIIPKRELSLELQRWPIDDTGAVKNVMARWSKLLQ
jgi:hypothetical protein